MARCRIEFSSMGLLAWPVAGRAQAVAAMVPHSQQPSTPCLCQPCVDVSLRESGMGLFLYESAHCYSFLQETADRVMLTNLRHIVEYVAGERDTAPPALQAIPLWVLRSLTWVLAIAIIYAFCGQSSRFIYIDF